MAHSSRHGRNRHRSHFPSEPPYEEEPSTSDSHYYPRRRRSYSPYPEEYPTSPKHDWREYSPHYSGYERWRGRYEQPFDSPSHRQLAEDDDRYGTRHNYEMEQSRYRDRKNYPDEGRHYPSYDHPESSKRSGRPSPGESSEASPQKQAGSPPLINLEPSPSYLATSLSTSASEENPSRKLLVLDLNGTLLLRSKWKSKAKLRAVHARPYLPAFIQYLFHPDTNLDVMVWSSAQPHSVDDMVRRVFGPHDGLPDYRNELVAIWARDTLGLTAEDYGRKSQTIKDLEKPWSQLFSSEKRTRRSISPPSSGELSPRTQHSALSTILLDDSPLKAQMQPYNHLCLREYIQEMRSRDVIAERQRRQSESSNEDYTFDDTLIAAVGVLEAIRKQSNVAAWVRSGGLWPNGAPALVAVDKNEDSTAQSEGNFQDQPTLAFKKERHRKRKRMLLPVNSLEEVHTNDTKRTRLDHELVHQDSERVAGDSATVIPADEIKNDATEAEVSNHVDADGVQEDIASTMWFDDPDTYRHWVDKGMQTLLRLEIPLRSGIIV